jgi:hypothetical protein
MRATGKGVSVALWTATAVAAFGIGRITSPPHGPSPPDDLLASLRSALGEGDAVERQRQTASLLEHLDPDALPEAAALYEQMIPVIESSDLAAFFVAWARFDPTGAIDHALSWSLPEMREQREIGVRAAIRIWAQRDLSAARPATEQIAADNPRLRDALPSDLVAGWVRSGREREGLADFIADLPPLRRRDEAVRVAIREFVRRGGAEDALGWAEPILRDEVYELAFKRSVFAAAADSSAQWDSERAAAWVAEHSGADYAKEGVGIVARHWSRRDGAAAMAWLAEQPAGDFRDQAVREAFGQWSRAHPRYAQAWLKSEELTAFHDPALEVKAKRLVAYEPQRALGWCERIRDTERQQSCLESTARSWYARDAVAAETWLQQSSLDDETRSRVRKTPRQQGQQRRNQRRPRAAGDSP